MRFHDLRHTPARYSHIPPGFLAEYATLRSA
jgi:hypothetical protein